MCIYLTYNIRRCITSGVDKLQSRVQYSVPVSSNQKTRHFEMTIIVYIFFINDAYLIHNTVANRLCAHRYPRKIDYPLFYFPPKISTQYRICITDVSANRCIHYPRYFAFPHRQRIVDELP